MDPKLPSQPLRIATPTVQLPAGISDVTADPEDEAIAGQLLRMPWTEILRIAQGKQREGRRAQRRAISRPAAKRARQRKELDRARLCLITAGTLAALADRQRGGLTITAVSVARARQRAAESMDREPGAYAVTVENQLRDLAGHERLIRG